MKERDGEALLKKEARHKSHTYTLLPAGADVCSLARRFARSMLITTVNTLTPVSSELETDKRAGE